MPRRKARGRQADYAHFRVKVVATSVYISHRAPDPKYDQPGDEASTYVTIEGTLDQSVIRRRSAVLRFTAGMKGAAPPAGPLASTM
jgi:hypothetical protein